MLDLERQQEILDILLQKKSARVAELAKKLDEARRVAAAEILKKDKELADELAGI